jgi:hypothetical protein
MEKAQEKEDKKSKGEPPACKHAWYGFLNLDTAPVAT